MILGIGNDIIEISRIQQALENPKFKDRVFTTAEQNTAGNSPKTFASYAKRFAAKEACAKALGFGFSKGVSWQDIHVINLPSGRPTIELAGKALEHLTSLTPENMTSKIDVSLSDTDTIATAMVVISAV